MITSLETKLSEVRGKYCSGQWRSAKCLGVFNQPLIQTNGLTPENLLNPISGCGESALTDRAPELNVSGNFLRRCPGHCKTPSSFFVGDWLKINVPAYSCSDLRSNL